jgi:phenylacetate-CoA ligase
MRETLKSWAACISPRLGKPLANVPYSVRLGGTYNRSRQDIAWFEMHSTDDVKSEIAGRVKRIVQSACETVAFYRHLYERFGVGADNIHGVEDIERVPIVSKEDLSEIPLETRSAYARGRIRINTGGTSGESLHFFADRNAFAREWGHMHFIWERLGYRTTDVKLTFRGKNLGERPIRYNAVHNEYLVNAYCPQARVLEAVRQVAAQVRFIHGYPSSIYEFVRRCGEEAPDIVMTLRAHLKGILLASEYPAPVYRELIAEELRVPSISWYGHSEMAILAYEVEPFLYVPLHSYGFCEAIRNRDGTYRLVGTSYYNNVSPFIRYDTGDLVVPEFKEGVLKSFRIAEGRLGDFVIDAAGDKISLTALIFGRHHPAFEDAKFVQICQERGGQATLLVTVNSGSHLGERELAARFDLSSVDIDFSVRILPEPIRSASGKVPLRVSAGAVRQVGTGGIG